MIPLIMFTIQYCVLNQTGGGINSTLANTSSVGGLLDFLNKSPCIGSAFGGNNLFGFAMLAIVMIVTFGIAALRFDVVVAGAAAGWIGVFASLFLIQLNLLGPNMIGISLSVMILMTVIALMRGGLRPY